MRKNSLPLEPICQREKLEEVERKLTVVLVKSEGRQRSPMASAEFTRRTPPSPTVLTG
jgi:hypothetical protein